MRSKIVATDNPIFEPPFLGERHLKGISLDEIAEFINETALFRMQWGYRPEKTEGEKQGGTGGETDADFKKRLRKTLHQWLNTAKTQDLLIPAVAYGFFPVNSDGNDLIVWEPADFGDASQKKEKMRFSFPRQKKVGQKKDDQLCIADFFRPLTNSKKDDKSEKSDSPETDYAAFSIVTMGAAISQQTAKLYADNSYSDYLHLHGLGVEMTEALAEYFHHRIRQEWGFGEEDDSALTGLFRQRYRGGRYSWGYPACPDLEDNEKVAKLLKAKELGIEVGEQTSWQYQPEQTTSAIICHHPQAKYFNVD